MNQTVACLEPKNQKAGDDQTLKNSKFAYITSTFSLLVSLVFIFGFPQFGINPLYNEIDQITNTKISWNYGIGLIYTTPLGPIRIDIGFPYGDLSQPQLHASLLYMF